MNPTRILDALSVIAMVTLGLGMAALVGVWIYTDFIAPPGPDASLAFVLVILAGVLCVPLGLGFGLWLLGRRMTKRNEAAGAILIGLSSVPTVGALLSVAALALSSW